MLRAQGLTHVAAKIGRHRVVVQQRIVDVEQEHDILDRSHHRRSCLSFLYSVAAPMPSRSAALARLPPVARSAAAM